MRKNILFIIIVLAIASCGKYEEGPGFSLRSKKNRLSGEWEFKKVLYNDKVYEYEGDIIRNNVKFDEDGEFSMSEIYSVVVIYGQNGEPVKDDYLISYSGEWEFFDNKENLELKYEYDSLIVTYDYPVFNYQKVKANGSKSLEIKKLTKDEFWYTYKENDTTEVYTELEKK